jgi:prepilin-type N-terminal cleavage/methylation domain-containing protein
MSCKTRLGFTLIETIISIAIMAILAAILVPIASSTINRTNEAADLANARILYTAGLIALIDHPDMLIGEYMSLGDGSTPTEFKVYLGSTWPVPLQINALYFSIRVIITGEQTRGAVVQLKTQNGIKTYSQLLGTFISDRIFMSWTVISILEGV